MVKKIFPFILALLPIFLCLGIFRKMQSPSVDFLPNPTEMALIMSKMPDFKKAVIEQFNNYSKFCDDILFNSWAQFTDKYQSLTQTWNEVTDFVTFFKAFYSSVTFIVLSLGYVQTFLIRINWCLLRALYFLGYVLTLPIQFFTWFFSAIVIV